MSAEIVTWVVAFGLVCAGGVILAAVALAHRRALSPLIADRGDAVVVGGFMFVALVMTIAGATLAAGS